VWLRKKIQNLPTSCTSCRLNLHNQLSRLCVYGVYKRPLRMPPKENVQFWYCGHWRQEHRGAGPDQNVSCPHSRSRDQHSVGGHPREVRWTVTASKAKDSNSSDSRKTFIILIFYLYYRFFWIYFSFFSSSVVVVNFPALRNLIKLLGFFFFFFWVTFFIVVINPCLYVGLLKFWGVFLVLSLFLI